MLRWIVVERWQLLGQLRPSPRLEKHVALQLWPKFSVSSLEVMVIRWKRVCCDFASSGWRYQDLDRSVCCSWQHSHLISRRWLSQHRCLVNFDPHNLCLEKPRNWFGSSCASSDHLLLSLVNPSNTLDQHTVMIDYQNSPSSVVNGFQKRDEQTMGSSQPRDQATDKRTESDEERAADSSMVLGRSDHFGAFIVSLEDPNEEITEEWQDGLHDRNPFFLRVSVVFLACDETQKKFWQRFLTLEAFEGWEARRVVARRVAGPKGGGFEGWGREAWGVGGEEWGREGWGPEGFRASKGGAARVGEGWGVRRVGGQRVGARRVERAMGGSAKGGRLEGRAQRVGASKDGGAKVGA